MDYEAHIRDRLAGASVRQKPFPHLYVDQIFPPDLYGEMLESLPTQSAIDACKPNAPTDDSRVFDLHGTNEGRGNGLDDLADRWQSEFRPFIDALSRILVQKWKPETDNYLSHMRLAGWMKREPESIDQGQSLFCFRPARWQIEPHTHGLTQLLQTMVYFPSDGFSRKQGTYFYRPLPWGRPSINDQVKAVTTFRASPLPALMPFAHNALVSWINTPKAVHGTIDKPGGPPRRYIFLAHVIDQSVFTA